MFPRQNQNQFRTANADVQIFYGSGVTAATLNQKYSWIKPIGVSHVYMLLIGAGGGGDGSSTGGGSGAVTVWYGAAQNVPNNLQISVGNSLGSTAGGNTTIYYQGTNAGITSIINAQGGQSNGNPGSAMTANQFTNSGFFQSTSGQSGMASGTPQTASSTTFLSGGASGFGLTANYGYKLATNNQNGLFQLQPVIVGMGGSAITLDAIAAGIGCGGAMGVSGGGSGGPGMVLIASW